MIPKTWSNLCAQRIRSKCDIGWRDLRAFRCHSITKLIVYDIQHCHPKMQVKTLFCKEGAISEHDPEMPSSLGQSLFKLKWYVAKWKTVLLLDESKCEFFFGNHEHHIICPSGFFISSLFESLYL